MAKTTAYTDGSGEELIEQIRGIDDRLDALRDDHNGFVTDTATALAGLYAAIERIDAGISEIRTELAAVRSTADMLDKVVGRMLPP